MNSVETMTILASIKHEVWKSKILNLKFCNCVRCMEDSLWRLNSKLPQKFAFCLGRQFLEMLDNLRSEKANSQIFSIIENTEIENKDQLNIKNISFH